MEQAVRTATTIYYQLLPPCSDLSMKPKTRPRTKKQSKSTPSVSVCLCVLFTSSNVYIATKASRAILLTAHHYSNNTRCIRLLSTI